MHAVLLGTLLFVGCGPSEPEPPQPARQPIDPKVAELFARLDENPDILHADYTPAVHELIAIGRPTIAPALDLMLSDNEFTRMHAQRVIEGVTLREHRFVFGQGWTRPTGAAEWKQFWTRLGDLNDRASAEARRASVAKWRVWLSDNP